MADRSWATTPDLEDLIVKALANGADAWTVSTESRTRGFLAEKERLQGEVSFIPIIHSFIVLRLVFVFSCLFSSCIIHLHKVITFLFDFMMLFYRLLVSLDHFLL